MRYYCKVKTVKKNKICRLMAFPFQTFSLSFYSLNFQLPENLLSKYDWIKQWQLRQKPGKRMGEIKDEIKECLIFLRKKVGKVVVYSLVTCK